jgi:hypothetical protein
MRQIDPAVVVGLVWRKAQSSTGHGACVEVASTCQLIAVRDSKNPLGTVLSYNAPDWRAFLDEAKKGAFDLSG